MSQLYALFDRWGGVVLVLCGVYSTLWAYGWIKEKVEEKPRISEIRSRHRLIGPLMIAFGLLKVILKHPWG
jgi:hypothetical protein